MSNILGDFGVQYESITFLTDLTCCPLEFPSLYLSSFLVYQCTFFLFYGLDI